MDRDHSEILSDAEAAAVIGTQFPTLRALSVVQLGEGTDHRAFDAGGIYVFRFPKSDEAAERLAVEARLTDWLGPQLPLAIPSYRHFGRPFKGFPRSFGGYQKLAGKPALLFENNRIDLADVGHRIGHFLRKLHQLDTSEAEELGLPRDDDPTLEEWSIDAVADLRFSRQRGYLDDAELARWERVLAVPPTSESTLCRILHGDLAAEHVLLNEHGTPVAVIDWSDAVLGDPARDLAGPIHWGGERMLSFALETYGAVDDAVLKRAQWFAAARAVADIAFGDAQQRKEYVFAGQRALAWLKDSRLFG